MAVALPELLILTCPGASSRHGEVAAFAAAASVDRPRMTLDAPARSIAVMCSLWGARCSSVVGPRTNAEGVATLALAVRAFGFSVKQIDIAEFATGEPGRACPSVVVPPTK